jgi:hypothetical protein
MAARALGKIGDVEATADLVRVLKDETKSLHVLSSAAVAVVALEGPSRRDAALVFATVARLTERDERYELLTALCAWLSIPSEWLLRAEASDSAWAALRDAVAAGAAPSAAVYTHFEERDLAGIRACLAEAVGELPADERQVADALAAALARTERWSVLAVLASAWLLLR